MYQFLILSVQDRLATVTLNRAENGNAVTPDVYREIKMVIEAYAADSDVGAIVLTGSGKHFSSGGDIKNFRRLIDEKIYINPDNIRLAGATAAAIRRCPKPVVALVNGAAAGAGCSIALACDFRYVAPSSKFILSFIKLGLPGDTGGMYFLQQIVGTAKATELAMTGLPVDGTQAVAVGLATKLVSEEKLQEETYQFAHMLAQSPTLALAKQKELLNRFFYSELESFSELEAESMAVCSKSEDFDEAVTAFLEKRQPIFKGK